MDVSAARGGPISRVLAHDRAVVRRGLELLLGAEEASGSSRRAGDVGAAIRTTRGHQPDVLVLDLNMPGGSSLDAIPTILKASPTTSICVLKMDLALGSTAEAIVRHSGRPVLLVPRGSVPEAT